MSRYLPILLACLTVASCVAHPQGLGNVYHPQINDHPRFNAGLSVGGSLNGGLVQSRLSSQWDVSDWFVWEFGLIVTGIRDSKFQSLQEAQDLKFNIGVLPYIAPIFYIGRVHVRLMLFGIGGGGPEGPAGVIGMAGGSLGYHFDRLSLYAGGLAFYCYGLQDSEFSSYSIQIPVGLSYDIPFGERSNLYSVGIEAIYSKVTGDIGSTHDDYQTFTATAFFNISFGT